MIRITDHIALDEDEIAENFIRSSGPGGQNVNKVETAVQLRFDAGKSAALSESVLARLRKIAGYRMTADGIIIISASKYRSQLRNREDALGRLVALIREAAVPPKNRRPTRPSKAAKARRVEVKKKRGSQKKQRSKKISFE